MSRANDLTAEALQGYRAPEGDPVPYLWSSPCWYAFMIGRCFMASGRSEPRDVRMGRGSRVRVSDMVYRYEHQKGREGWSRES